MLALDGERKDRELQFKQDQASIKDAMEQIKQAAEVLNKQADTWNKMREAMGLDAITGPGGMRAFIDQAAVIRESQAEQP